MADHSKTALYSTLIPCYLCAWVIVQFGKKYSSRGIKKLSRTKEFSKSPGVEF